jgi:hypothetical protein
MQVWHPKSRFETIAVDVLEISPTSATGMKKVVLIGNVFSRFMMVIAVPAETAACSGARTNVFVVVMSTITVVG